MHRQKIKSAIEQLERVHRDMTECSNKFILKDAIDQLNSQMKTVNIKEFESIASFFHKHRVIWIPQGHSIFDAQKAWTNYYSDYVMLIEFDATVCQMIVPEDNINDFNYWSNKIISAGILNNHNFTQIYYFKYLQKNDSWSTPSTYSVCRSEYPLFKCLDKSITL